MNKDVKIIINITKRYKDIADIFFYLFKSNWPDCPYDYIISYNDGLEFGNYGKNKYIANENDTLPTSIKKISDAYPARYYICLLGDAFISQRVNTDEFNKIIDLMRKNNIDYCNLYTSKRNEQLFQYIKKDQIYGMSFIAFVASNNFIKNEFKNNISDVDFEEKWLRKACSYSGLKRNEKKYCDKIENTNNILNIVHGIQNGKWFRKSYRKLKKYQIVKENDREKISMKNTFILFFKSLIRNKISPKKRYYLKKLLSKLGMKFASKY